MKSEKQTLIVVNYRDLENEVKDAWGHEWSFPGDQESSNDVDHSFYGISGEEDIYDNEAFEDFKKSGKPTFYMAREILNALVREGRIEAGDYLIRVSW